MQMQMQQTRMQMAGVGAASCDAVQREHGRGRQRFGRHSPGLRHDCGLSVWDKALPYRLGRFLTIRFHATALGEVKSRVENRVRPARCG